MRIPQLLLGLVLASALLLAAAAWLATAPGTGASPHPEHPTLLVGEGAAARAPGVLVLGWAFGAVQIAFFGACFALGMRRAEGLGPLRGPLWAGLALYELLWTAVVLAYAAFARDPAGAGEWGGFPLPTALMLFGLWPFPVWFAVLYLRHFEGWVLDDAGLERFRARVAALERERGAGPDTRAAPDAGPE